MSRFLDNCENDFKLFKKELPFHEKLEDLSKTFGLSANDPFEPTIPATYFAGNYTAAKFFWVGINPKNAASVKEFELSERTKDYKSYLDFLLNVFQKYSERGAKIPYAGYMASCFALDKNETIGSDKYLSWCQQNACIVDIIPYYSKSYTGDLNPQSEQVLLTNFEILIEFIKNETVENPIVIIHKSQLFRVLQNQGYLLNAEIVYSQNGRIVYSITDENLQIYLFNRFIPNGGFGREECQKILNRA